MILTVCGKHTHITQNKMSNERQVKLIQPFCLLLFFSVHLNKRLLTTCVRLRLKDIHDTMKKTTITLQEKKDNKPYCEKKHIGAQDCVFVCVCVLGYLDNGASGVPWGSE